LNHEDTKARRRNRTQGRNRKTSKKPQRLTQPVMLSEVSFERTQSKHPLQLREGVTGFNPHFSPASYYGWRRTALASAFSIHSLNVL